MLLDRPGPPHCPTVSCNTNAHQHLLDPSFSIRQKQQGSRVLVPVEDMEGSEVTVQEVAEAGRATLWCQVRVFCHLTVPS